MKNIKVHCKKAWKGCVDVRDHIANDAIKNQQNIIVTCDKFDGDMVLTPEMLLTPKMVSKDFKSQFTGTYKLNSYEWKNKKYV